MNDNQAKTTVEEVDTHENTVGGADAGTVTENTGAGDASAQNDSENDSMFDSTEDHDDGADGKTKDTERNKARDAENARRRREAERQKELKQTREKAIIDALRGKNPYTNGEMKDSADVEEYLVMREIEDKGGDPVADYPGYRKQQQREANQKREENEQKEEWYQKDRDAFVKAFPSVDLEELVADEDFREYADGKVGRKPLTEIYNGFLKFVDKYNEKAKARAAQYLANKQASPGALNNSGTAESDFFTFEQVSAMSQEDVRKNFEKIQESMKKWK